MPGSRNEVVSFTEQRELFFSDKLIAAGQSVVSDWINALTVTRLNGAKKSAGGNYRLEAEWSRDGVDVAVVTTLIEAEESATLDSRVHMPFVRLRVRNTDALTAFTDHVTVVIGS